MFRQQNHAELLIANGQLSAAIEEAEDVYEEAAQDSNTLIYAKNAVFLLYDAYKEQGNTVQALQYLEKGRALEAELERQKALERQEGMRIRFETEMDVEKERREHRELQLRNEIAEKDLQRQTVWRNFLIVLSILGLAITLLLINRFKLKSKALVVQQDKLRLEKEKLSLEIEHKNRELTSTSMFVAEKNNMLVDLESQLVELNKKLEGPVRMDVMKLKREIRKNVKLEDDWESIRSHFVQVFPGYLDRLKDAFPELTNLELRHCAYLKMKLSIKEVARMLHVAPKSVHMSHYRLKKKLNLPSEDSLGDFLQRFK